ncbi:MAG: TetR/AcrR family transcriptional regulator [Pseudomonadota bacterium]
MDHTEPPPDPLDGPFEELFRAARFDTPADRTRAEIVARSFELFGRYGYTKTNIGEIAEACAMSPGNLYRYFRNKQAIGQAVVDAFMTAEALETRRLLGAPLAPEAPAPHAARLRAYVALLVMRTVVQLRRAPRIIELAEMIRSTPDGLEMVGPHIMRRTREIEAILRAGAAAGEFQLRDPVAATAAVEFATRFFHIPDAITQHGLERIESDLELTLDLVCAGLRAGAV